jgi:hypothetical protein
MAYLIGNKRSSWRFQDVRGGKRKKVTDCPGFSRERATIISDSLCQKMENCLMARVQVIHGGTMSNVAAYIRYGNLVVSPFEAIIVAFGTNDLTDRVHFTICAERIVSSLDRALTEIQRRNPNAKFGVSGIMPRPIDANNVHMRDARIYANVSIRAFCDTIGISYYTSETCLNDRDPADGDLFRWQDLIHLSDLGAFHYQSYLEGKVTELISARQRLHSPPAVLPVSATIDPNSARHRGSRGRRGRKNKGSSARQNTHPM